MKKLLKYFCLVLLLVIFNGVFHLSNQVFAARPGQGESCCQAGYSYNDKRGNCLNDEVGNVIDSYAAPATCLALLQSGATNANVLQSCKNKVSQAYKDILASRPYLQAGEATVFCSVLATGSITTPFLTFDQAVDACSRIFVGVFQRINNIVKTEIPTSCDSGFQCNATGTCVLSPSTPSSPLTPYNPTCAISTFIQGGRTRVDTEGVKTALGCLPVNPQNFVDIAIPWTIGIGAGIAFLLGVLGAAMITLSAGNPEKMQAGKEMITSAIAGTIIIAFAVFLLDFIGVKVLKLFSF